MPTITQWLGVLETTAQILIVPPFYENLGKRLIKSPKIYVADSGLACHLLGIDTAAELAKSPFLGSLFEGFIASEIIKAPSQRGRAGRSITSGMRKDWRWIFWCRDAQASSLVECKATRTVTPAMAAPMRRLAGALKGKRGAGTRVDMVPVHQAPKAGAHTSAVAPGVRALPWRDFIEEL